MSCNQQGLRMVQLECAFSRKHSIAETGTSSVVSDSPGFSQEIGL